VRTGVLAGLASSLAVAFPSGDMQGKMVAKVPARVARAMEGRWHSGEYAEITFIGQPDVLRRRVDNPLRMPGILSFIAYGSFSSNVKGLDEFPRQRWPTSIEMLYYSFHIMVGLGTIFIAIMGLSVLLLWSGRSSARGPCSGCWRWPSPSRSSRTPPAG